MHKNNDPQDPGLPETQGVPTPFVTSLFLPGKLITYLFFSMLYPRILLKARNWTGSYLESSDLPFFSASAMTVQ
jgi:hypothetical protein